MLESIEMATEKCDLKEEEIFKVPERYLVFIDETGDPFLHKDIKKYDHPTVFPVLTVTALIVAAPVYKDVFVPSVDAIKQEFWEKRDIHFHSNEIRRKDGIFKVLLDDAKYNDFKQKMVGVLETSSVTIISSSINKMKLLEKAKKFKEKTGSDYNVGDLYLTNISWIFERLGDFLKGESAKIIFETRGKKESKRIQGMLADIKKNGTFYHSKDLFRTINDEVLFFTKEDNVNGVQLADYCTYPLARHAKDKTDGNNKLFDVIRKHLYKGDFGEYGLKEWP